MTYTEYWNLSEAPFQNVTDTRFAFLSSQHHEGLARLIYLAENRRLGGVLTGPYGVGKSMVLHLLAEQLKTSVAARVIAFDYMPGNALNFVHQVLDAAGESLQDAADLPSAMRRLRAFREAEDSGQHTVIAVDEAQMIADPSVCQALHLIMNMTLTARRGAGTRSAFTLLLCGYADVTRILAQDPSLCQRLQLVWRLDPLTAEQTVEYIQHRLRIVGGEMWIFDQEALKIVYESTRGLPRLINNLCDIALMLGYAAGLRQVNPAIAMQAAADVQYPQEDPAANCV